MTVEWAKTAGIALAALAISALVTRMAIAYAHRRRLIDEPGRRRSHAMPTPRGGGIGMVIAVLACLGVPLLVDGTHRVVIPLAYGLVAAIGWIDDHRPLSARLRIFVHAVAAALVFVTAMHVGGVAFDAGTAFGALVIVFALVGSINLHNFMDGIDGLLAVQGVFVCAVIGVLSAMHGDGQVARAAFVVGAATLGFLPFNFPRARIFMGDVGSGSLGFALGLLCIAAAGQGATIAACVAIAVSAFVIDAGATLLSRMLAGRRWYSAHREHLYQWLVRDGRSHSRVVGLYAGWNVLVVLPVVGGLVASRAAPMAAIAVVAAVYLLGTGLWIAGKRRCLENVRTRARN